MTELQDKIKQAFGDKPSVELRGVLFEEIGYVPTAKQAEFHYWDGRFKLVAGGEQAGKSKSAAMELFSFLPWGGLYWIVGPTYEQTRKEFEYVEQALVDIGALASAPSKPDRGPWYLETVWGTIVKTKSAQELKAIANEAPDGILLVEAAQCPYEAFLRCMGRVGPTKGWVCVNGTFEGSVGWYVDRWRMWQGANDDGGRSFSLPSWTNKYSYPGGLEDEEIERLKRIHDEDWFSERFLGIPVPPRDLVFREFDFTRHVKIIDRSREPSAIFPDGQRVVLPEDTEDELWIDPGYAGGYAVLFVTVYQDYVFVYDEIYKTGWISEEMAQAAMRHPRWKYVKKLVMDVAGKQHQAQKAPYETWRDVTGLTARMQRVLIPDGIERTRVSLRENPETHMPQLIFGSTCHSTHAEFAEKYRYHQDQEGRVTSEKPMDKDNHAAKAIAYGLTDHFGPIKRNKKKYDKPPRRVAGFELWR